MAEAPDHLRDLLIDAPFTAAETVFEAALIEEVDFILLAGDILHVEQAGPRAISFLIDHFEKLNAADISVYWAGGQADPPDRWPSTITLPPNVHMFSSHEVEELTHYRGEEPAASILGQSWFHDRQFRASDYRPESEGLFTAAVWHGHPDSEELAIADVHYWALGGRHERKKLAVSPKVACYSGSPQGRCPTETGKHGCFLVQTDRKGQVRTKSVSTDAVRFRNEKITLEPRATAVDLTRLAKQRVNSIINENAGVASLISWQIDGAAYLGSQARENSVVDQLRNDLRSEFGHRNPPTWTTSIDMDPPAEFPALWYEEDTILGDFLRAVKARQEDKGFLPIEDLLDDDDETAVLSSAVAISDPEVNGRVLREAAALAVEMLGGSGREDDQPSS